MLKKLRLRLPNLAIAFTILTLAAVFLLIDVTIIGYGKSWVNNLSVTRIAIYVVILSCFFVFRKRLKNYLEESGCLNKIKIAYYAVYFMISIPFFGFYIYNHKLNGIQINRMTFFSLVVIFLLFALCILYIGDIAEKNVIAIGASLISVFPFITQINHGLDELVHFSEAYNASLGHFINVKNAAVIPSAFINIPYNMPFWKFISACHYHIDYRAISAPLKALPAGYPTLLYAPSTIGLFIGRLFNFSVVNEIYIGRFANFLFYAIMTYFIVKLLPFGKNIALVVMFSPYIALLASSYSIDGVGMAFITFFIALCLHYAYSEQQLKKRDLALLAVVALMVLLFKGCSYSISLAMILLIPLKRFTKNKKAISLIKIIVPVCLAITVSIVLYKIYKMPLGTGDHRGGTMVDQAMQIRHIYHHPLFTMSAFWKWFGTTLFNPAFLTGVLPDYFFGSGTVLVFPIAFLWFFTAATDYNLGEKGLKKELLEKALLLLYILSCCVLLPAAMYIAFTNVGSQDINGVGFRYFFPVFPALLLLINSKRVKNTIRNYNSKIAFFSSLILVLSQWYLIIAK